MNSTIRKWILLADGDDKFRKSISDLLVSHFGDQIKIIQTDNGGTAISKIKNQVFHLIISSLDLPKKSGKELVQAVRQNQFNQTSPIVLLSEGTEEENAKIEKSFEFVNCVTKPVDPYEFAKVIRNIFSIGSTEKMISASIFSSLLDSSLGFLKEALKRDDFKVGEMKFKKKGEELTADQAAIITVHIGKVSNTFSVLCSAETLEALMQGSEKISGKSLNVICKSLGYVILKHVLTECGIINHNEVKTKDITQDPMLLTEKQGIIVPISANNINYKIFATTKGDEI